ncbi:MAG: GtrA family protein, partial [Acidimicrobiales bacterium]
MAWARSPIGYKAIRYTATSCICLGITQVVLALTFGVWHIATSVDCQIIATAVATVPSYTLNRRWAWRRDGRSHLWKEVVPFWTLAAVSFVFSLYIVDLATEVAKGHGLSHLWVSVVVNAASFCAYGVLWVGKFVIFNRLLFSDRGRPGTVPPGARLGG